MVQGDTRLGVVYVMGDWSSSTAAPSLSQQGLDCCCPMFSNTITLTKLRPPATATASELVAASLSSTSVAPSSGLPRRGALPSLQQPKLASRASCARRRPLRQDSEISFGMMEEGSDYYLVRKGELVAVYKTLNDCQAQICSSVSGPAASAYKGYSWSREKEEYLCSRGLSNATYVINATELSEDFLGTLTPCTFQDAMGSSRSSAQHYSQPLNQGYSVQGQAFNRAMVCLLHFDGASKGNPGKGGAGAVLMTEDGRVISRLREGLGVVTNNVAEYRGLILGLKYAIRHGFKKIIIYGDSQLVCYQVKGTWQTKNQNMMELCKEVRKLKENFISFEINHEWNAEADRQANIGITLSNGVVSEERGDGS
uniref:RNase H type-1 domain-containing protein n=1 Tax=Leersia perrieri TaxID=77586 RepID=A0A0D9XKB9_9ORYZ